MSRHVVFGAGQIGAHVVDQLLVSGNDVVVASRSGRTVPTGARAINGDLTNAEFATTAADGAAVIYFCLNALTAAGRAHQVLKHLRRHVSTPMRTAIESTVQ